MKRNPESLLDPRSQGERQAGGQSSVVYLTVGGRACSVMRHLTMVAGLVPSRTCGTRGSWWSSGGEWPGSTEGGRGRSSLLVEGQQRHVRRLDAHQKLFKGTFKRLSKTSKRPSKTSKRPPLSESAREFMDLPQRGGALVNTPRCPPLIGQVLRPTFPGWGLGPCRETPATPPRGSTLDE